MRLPGVRALIGVTFASAVDNPERFARSRVVEAYFALTRKKYQSGETDITGAEMGVGDPIVRTALKVAKRRGMRWAKVALARKLAVIPHRMWIDGTTSAGAGRELPHKRSKRLERGEFTPVPLRSRRRDDGGGQARSSAVSILSRWNTHPTDHYRRLSLLASCVPLFGPQSRSLTL
jgi:hypothetical protein